MEKEEQAAKHQADHSAHSQGAESGHVEFQYRQGQGQENKHCACPVNWQVPQGNKGQHQEYGPGNTRQD